MQYDIFISYKRLGSSSATAAYLYDLLTKKGYAVFFDRKEMRSGRFDTQLLEHISNAKDIIVLLEKNSLASCFNGVDKAYKTDWFCMEVMQSLAKERHIIPVTLDSYQMPDPKDLPDELKALSLHNALPLDISQIEDFYQKNLVKELQAKPRNLFLAQQSGEGIANFLFFCEEDCDIYEYGNLVARLDQNMDEEHPYTFPVKFAGEHRFRIKNNDTCEEQRIAVTIEKDKQLYVPITWEMKQNLWEIDETIIKQQRDPNILYQWGRGLFEGSCKHEPNLELALLCLKKASLWNNDAEHFVLRHVETIFNKEKSSTTKIPWLKFAADELKSESAMFYLGKIYQLGIGVEPNIKEALSYYEKAAEHNEPRAYVNLGIIYFYGRHNIPKDIQKGLEYFKKSEDRPLSLNNLGYIYFYGQNGVDKDVKKGLEYYEKSASLGNDYALNNVGNIYFYGRNGIETDTEKGLEYYEKSAKLGNISAINTLGDIYFFGRGDVAADPAKGIEYFEKSAKLDNDFAMEFLAAMYYTGNSVPQDFTMAKEYLEKASSIESDGSANKAFSIMYKRGLGVSQNDDLARHYDSRFQNMVDRASNKANCYNGTATTLYLMGEYEEALPYALKAVDLEKDHKSAFGTQTAVYKSTLANIYKSLGKYKEALATYQEALDLGKTEVKPDIEEIKKLI